MEARSEGFEEGFAECAREEEEGFGGVSVDGCETAQGSEGCLDVRPGSGDERRLQQHLALVMQGCDGVPLTIPSQQALVSCSTENLCHGAGRGVPPCLGGGAVGRGEVPGSEGDVKGAGGEAGEDAADFF